MGILDLRLWGWVGICAILGGCGGSEPNADHRGNGQPWSFEQPHPVRTHPRRMATGFERPLACEEYPVGVKVDFTTTANPASTGESAVWNLDRPRVWIVPRGFADDRADHYFECWLDHRNGSWVTSEMAFSCSGILGVPLEAYESGWVRPTFESLSTTMVWSFYDENRNHLADFEYEFDVYSKHEHPLYRGENDCYRLRFRRTLRKIEGGAVSYRPSSSA